MTPRMQNSSCIGQHECEVIHTYLTRIVQVLCLGDHIHIELPGHNQEAGYSDVHNSVCMISFAEWLFTTSATDMWRR